MNVLGIVAEYNPFHQGHKYLIDTASALTEADVCISVMSGPFVQRGGFSFFDKWKRSEEAIIGGNNLVLELPAVYATSSARYFATAAVNILASAGVTHIAFGSETGNIDELINAERAISEIEEKFGNEIREEQAKGLSYPLARQNILKEKCDIDDKLLTLPNNILAIEYLRAIREGGYDIRPVTVERSGESHQESASRIRSELERSEQGQLLKEMADRYFDLLKSKVVMLTGEELDFYDVGTEGLGFKIKKEIRNANDLEELIDLVKSKRYTYTRISRFITGIILDIDPKLRESKVAYMRPLAMDQKGASYLKDIKKRNAGLVIDDIPKFVNEKSMEIPAEERSKILDLLDTDIRSGDIYSIIRGVDLKELSDYTRHPQLLHL